MEASALRELLGDVAWGALDVLLLDLPPGMQRYLELCDILGAAPAVLTVTIPTPESRDAVRRAMRAAVERGSHLLGIVENMVGGELRGTAADELSNEFKVRCSRESMAPIIDRVGSAGGSAFRRSTHDARRTMKFLCVECDQQMAFAEGQCRAMGHSRRRSGVPSADAWWRC
jgi:MinD-like ATPase involved in chromosome partitioning or flagellar assembly